jgi:hypothetical protein
VDQRIAMRSDASTRIGGLGMGPTRPCGPRGSSARDDQGLP